MSRDNDREQELLEAARALAIELGYVEEDDNEELVDQSLLDDDDEEGMDIAREEIQALID